MACAGEDGCSPAIRLVGDLAAQGGKTNPSCPGSWSSAVRGPPHPSPASDLVLEPPTLPGPCLRPLSAPALPTPAKEGRAGCNCSTQPLSPWGGQRRGPEEALCAPLAREHLPFSCQKQRRGKGQRVCGRLRGLAAVPSELESRGAWPERQGWARAASPRCYPSPRTLQLKPSMAAAACTSPHSF